MHNILRIFAVDDEALAHRRLELLIQRIPEVELVGQAYDVAEAKSLIEKLRPDVLLLDIKLAEATGFDLLESLDGSHVPIVVFVTAFDRFAATAFEVGAADFVLKPVALDRLSAALERARRALFALDAEERLSELNRVVEALRSQTEEEAFGRYETEIWAERRNEFVRISVEELDWVAAERDYVRLHARGQSYLLRETLSAIQARLDPAMYLRVRRSALVRVDRVTGIRKAGNGHFRVMLADGSAIRVGRTYVRQVRRLVAPRSAILD